jgi:proline iminopeptidase
MSNGRSLPSKNRSLKETRLVTQPAKTEGPAPFDVRLVDVGDGHIAYVEQCGTRDGVPALYLHGGPGSGCQPSHRTLFDPSRFRAVLFDQRGAGRSRYTQRLVANTTQHLIGDMERIRADLEIDRWIIVGGSWGATLALAYAERHPTHVIGLVLRAVFLGTRRELEWAFLDGLARFRPEQYEAFLDALSVPERGDPLDAYWRRILDPDPAIHRHSAWLWHDVERALSELVPASPMPQTESRDLPSTPFVEAHYFLNGCFLRPGELLDNAILLASIPGIIVQGRYDMLCPPQTAAALAKRWGNARIDFVEGAGHAISEPGIRDALINGICEIGFSAA